MMSELNQKTYMLTLDLGSSGLKTAIISDQGDVVAHTYEPYGYILLPDGGAEQDAQLWWQLCLESSKRVIADAGVPKDRIVGICCDSQYFLTIPVNEHAEPLMNCISWRDTRGGKYNRKMMKGFPAVQGMSIRKLMKFIRYTGVAPTNVGADALAHMLFVKHELPDIYNKTHKFLEPVDYLTSVSYTHLRAHETLTPIAYAVFCL